MKMRERAGGSAASVQGSRARTIAVAIIAALVVFGILAVPTSDVEAAAGNDVVPLWADDFKYGTYIIDQPGTYRLMENISFNPNSPATLDAALASGEIPANVADMLDLSVPVDAYRAGMPLATQFQHGGGGAFTPGGPMDQRYDPAAYGVGFFAAIAIQADNVVLDLNGFTLDQSAEHALLQRFFSVVELADQPFIPNQGPASFGTELEAAENVTIKNGTLGRSSHHGIHGNANADVRISDVNFDGYEVGAVALNGVDGLRIERSVATNRKDVPVLGTFSAARFIGTYVDDLVRTGSTTTLTVDGATLTGADIQADLRAAINNVHHDVIGTGDGYINESAHPVEYALFHNEHGVIDGNSYSFLVNSIGVAVNGFPLRPDGTTGIPAREIFLNKVRVVDQHSFINEIPALNTGSSAAMIDPVGAVFQTLNTHPQTGAPVTVSSLDATQARYTGNPLANAQAFVAKAALSGDLGSGHLDISRLNISQTVIDWVEGAAGSETLASIGATYLCNGDSMFHVNKGTIGFKMDAADKVRLSNTSVDGLVNLGMPGSDVCGDYAGTVSHPAATIYGYGGAAVRGYTFSGTYDVVVRNARADNLSAMSGPAVGFAVLTDSDHVRLSAINVRGINAGWGESMPTEGPNGPAYAAGVYVGAESTGVRIAKGCATGLTGYDGTYFVHDESGTAQIAGTCRASR